MSLQSIMDLCSNLDVYEKRNFEEDYIELVFLNKETDSWIEMLTQALGPAAKPAKTKPSKDHLNITKDFGGIMDNQILFVKQEGDAGIIAMIWPWQDGEHSTLKVILA